MIKANQDIRGEVKKAGLKLWQIAEEFRMTDANFSRKLRKELLADEKIQLRKIIENLREDN